MKRRHFAQNTLFHLKANDAKNMSNSKLVLNFLFVQSSPQLQF